MHVSQAELPTLETIRELLVVDAEQVQHGRLPVVDVDRIAHDVIAELIRLAENRAGLNAAAGHPEAVECIVLRKRHPLAVVLRLEQPIPDALVCAGLFVGKVRIDFNERRRQSVKSSVTPRMSISRTASGDGESLFDSSFASTNWSIGLRTHF